MDLIIGWRELRLVCDAALAESLSDALMQEGAISVSVEDADAGSAAEQPLFGEPGSAVEAGWRRNTVMALVEAAVDHGALMERAAHAAGLDAVPSYKVADVAEQDWVRLTQAQFEPIRISARLWIVPSWHTAPDPAAIAIRLDPGLAFGTGSHPTTRMCLAWIDDQIRNQDKVLDYGCGSGILAIAASLLGASSVTATDVDPQALTATRLNAAANACAIDVFSAESLPAGTYSAVVANILTNPLKVLAPALSARVAPAGRLTLSGILESQAQEVIAAYAGFIALDVWRCEEGWVCLSGRKGIPD